MRAVWGIVVAGGRGERFGASKQFCELAGARVVDRSLASMAAVCDNLIVVLPAGVAWDGPAVAAVGGATRAASVRAGLALVPADAEIVVVHDAARPLASPSLVESVVAAVRAGADAAIPVLVLADTLKRVEGARVVGTVDRAALVAAQTPQAFRAAILRAAHARGDDATDDAALAEAEGAVVVTVPGETRNLKITTPADLALAAALLAAPG